MHYNDDSIKRHRHSPTQVIRGKVINICIPRVGGDPATLYFKCG